MKPTRASERFLNSTRGRVVALLRRGDRTVPELADALGLTRNAIRGHIAALERDGLVRQSGHRRGAGKPAAEYRLTEEGERLFPKAYAAALQALIASLAESDGGRSPRSRLREAGARLAAPWLPPAGASREERLEAALAALEELGAVVETEEQPDGSLRVRGYSCPLGEVVREEAAACALMQSLVERITGAPVEETCDRGERPRCSFTVGC